MKYALVIDIGASSGRHIVGRMEDGIIKTGGVYRFPNGVTDRDGLEFLNLECLKEIQNSKFAKK